jgi:hypothetical protein
MFYDLIYLIFIALYFAVSIKVDYWLTISILGFASETPEYFIRNSRAYDYFRGALFVLAVFFAILSDLMPWYVDIMFLFIAWLGAGNIGRKLSFKRYRTVLTEMLPFSETEQEKNDYLSKIQKTDMELLEETNAFLKK